MVLRVYTPHFIVVAYSTLVLSHKKASSNLFQKLFPESSCGFGNKVVTLRCRF